MEHQCGHQSLPILTRTAACLASSSSVATALAGNRGWAPPPHPPLSIMALMNPLGLVMKRTTDRILYWVRPSGSAVRLLSTTGLRQDAGGGRGMGGQACGRWHVGACMPRQGGAASVAACAGVWAGQGGAASPELLAVHGGGEHGGEDAVTGAGADLLQAVQLLIAVLQAASGGSRGPPAKQAGLSKRLEDGQARTCGWARSLPQCQREAQRCVWQGINDSLDQ